MKTKDGKDAEVNKTYYLENGQEVILNDFVTNSENKTLFLVTPFYEGETITCDGAGGQHNEYIMDYEHEGLEILVSDIFESEPLEKLGEEYKKKQAKIADLSKVVGFLIKKEEDTKRIISKLEKEVNEVVRKRDLMAKSFDYEKEKMERITDHFQKKRQELSEIEDSITSLKSEDVSKLVSKTELQRLNKRDFKLQCLENGGVDNWQWYEESLKDFDERYPS